MLQFNGSQHKEKKPQFTALQIIICIPFLFTRTIFQHVRKQPYVSAKRIGYLFICIYTIHIYEIYLYLLIDHASLKTYFHIESNAILSMDTCAHAARITSKCSRRATRSQQRQEQCSVLVPKSVSRSSRRAAPHRTHTLSTQKNKKGLCVFLPVLSCCAISRSMLRLFCICKQ